MQGREGAVYHIHLCNSFYQNHRARDICLLFQLSGFFVVRMKTTQFCILRGFVCLFCAAGGWGWRLCYWTGPIMWELPFLCFNVTEDVNIKTNIYISILSFSIYFGHFRNLSKIINSATCSMQYTSRAAHRISVSPHGPQPPKAASSHALISGGAVWTYVSEWDWWCF